MIEIYLLGVIASLIVNKVIRWDEDFTDCWGEFALYGVTSWVGVVLGIVFI